MAYNTRKGKPSGGLYRTESAPVHPQKCGVFSLKIYMKTHTITPTATSGRFSFRISENAKTLAVFAVLFLIYATVDGIADFIFGGTL